MTLLSLEQETLKSTLPTPEEIQKEIPCLDTHAAFVYQARETIEAILNGWDNRFLLVVGPCSIHDPVAALEYGRQLQQLAQHISDRFFLVMRTYFEKPRTIVGWKGMLYDPAIDGSYQMSKGVRQSRELLVELTEMGVPAGCELLEINTSHYYADLLSWGCIGARTCCSPPHRQLAAGLNMPIGFKNSIDGNIDHAIHGILSAATSHVYLGLSPTGHLTRIYADGNSACHVVLRGGILGPNYYPENIQNAVNKCKQAKICEKIMVDCSHDNCGKNPQQQAQVFCSLIQQILQGNRNIRGMMLESNLVEGSQDVSFPLRYGMSITDPCLDWSTTEHLILEAYNLLSQYE